MTAAGAIPGMVEALARLSVASRAPGETVAMRTDDVRTLVRVIAALAQEREALLSMLLRN